MATRIVPATQVTCADIDATANQYLRTLNHKTITVLHQDSVQEVDTEDCGELATAFLKRMQATRQGSPTRKPFAFGYQPEGVICNTCRRPRFVLRQGMCVRCQPVWTAAAGGDA